MEELDADDNRRRYPRFQEENLEANLALLKTLEDMADGKGCAPTQIALAWILAQGEDIVPIPGTRTRTHLKEIIDAADISITDGELDTLDQAFAPSAIAGERWPPGVMKKLNG